jgi:hypothetical protein
MTVAGSCAEKVGRVCGGVSLTDHCQAHREPVLFPRRLREL